MKTSLHHHTNASIKGDFAAATPEGLLQRGDVHTLRRFIQLSGAQGVAGEDLAKQLLLNAAQQTLVTAPNGQPMRLELWAWPFTVSFESPKRVSTAFQHGIKTSDVELRMRIRELWSNAFASQHGMMVAPQRTFLHMNALLGMSPLQIKHAVMQGENILLGGQVSQREIWGIPKDSFEASDPDIPATMLMLCYVAVGASDPSAVVAPNPMVQAGMGQLVRALFSSATDAPHRLRVGAPAPLSEAVTQAQSLQLAAMNDRALAMRRAMSVRTSHDADQPMLTRFDLEVDYFAAADEEPERSFAWRYTAMWRPASHLSDVMVQFDAMAETAARERAFQPHQGAFMDFGAARVFH